MKRLLLLLAAILIPSISEAQTTHGRIVTDRVSNTAVLTMTGNTPSVANGNIFKTANVASITVINFLGGVTAQRISVICGDTNTTIQNNANIVMQTGADFTCSGVGQEIDFLLDGSVWRQASSNAGGGGGVNPAGANGDAQCKNATSLTACHINDDGTKVTVSEDFATKINPAADIRAYGGVNMTLGIQPYIPGITATTTASNPTISISSASSFVNGEGVTIWGAGAAVSMSTPGAPTVTPSLASGPTGTGMVVNAPSGSTAFQYQIVAVDGDGGYTPAGTVGTTAIGNALGWTSVNLSSCSKTNLRVSCTTSSAHSLAVGAVIRIQNTLDTPNFGGWYNVATVPDNTHFTYDTISDTRAGGTTISPIATSTTGGTVGWTVANHITWTAIPGARFYLIYGNTSGSMALIGVSKLQNNIGTAISDPSWDDIGTTIGGTPTFLSGQYPNTPPVSGRNDSFTTTIASGAGTTTLTLTAAPVNSVSGATILADNGPAMSAALAATKQVYIPQGTVSIINSQVNLPTYAAIYQQGQMAISVPITANVSTQWYGDVAPGGFQILSFANTGGAPTQCSTAVGCLFSPVSDSSVNIRGISFTTTNNGYGLTIDNVDSLFVRDTSFSGPGGTNDGLTMPVLVRNAQFLQNWTNVTMVASQTGNSTTPLFFCNSCGTLQLHQFNLSGRGVFFNGVGLYVDYGRKQGGTSPAIQRTALYVGATVGGGAPLPFTYDDEVRHYELDTDPNPLIQIVGSPFPVLRGLVLFGTVASSQDTGGPLPLISGGNGYSNIDNWGGSRVNANLNVAQANTTGNYGSAGFGHPTYGTTTILSQFHLKENLNISGGNGLTVPFSVPAPTASVSTSCSGFPPAGNYAFRLSVVGPDGVESSMGPLSNIITLNGTTQCSALSWTDVPGVVGYKTFVYLNPTPGISPASAGAEPFGGGCNSFNTIIKANSCTETTGTGSTPNPTLNGTGNPSLWPGLLTTNNLTLGSITGGNYGTLSLQGNFTATRTLTLPDITANAMVFTGSFANSDCVKANVSGGVTSFVTLGIPCALTSSGLNQFASTTSAQLASVLSDETGTGHVVFDTSPTINTALSIAASGELHFLNGVQYVGFKAPATLGSNFVWALPNSDSSGTQCLSSNGSLVLAWSACSGGTATPGGSPGNIQYAAAGPTFAGDSALNWDATNRILKLGNSGSAFLGQLSLAGSTSGAALIVAQATAGTPTLTLPNTSGTFAASASAPLALSATTGALTCATCTTNAATLTSNALIVGGGSNAVSALASLGTTTTVLHGNVAGAPTFAAVSLTADVSGTLPLANGGTGQTTRQAAINALLPGANGDIFYRDLSGNVVSLAAVSAGACLVSGSIPAWGSCSTGSLTGAGTTGQITTWSTASTLTGSANYTYASSILTLLQGSNGASTQVWKRFTDTTPSGNAWELQNAAGSVVAKLDVSGNLAVNSLTTTGGCNGGTAGCAIFTQGTAPSITANASITLYAPSSVTDYRIALPGAASSGFLRGTNSAGTVTLAYTAASGIGSCTSTNNVVVALNDNAAPQCSSVAGPMFGTQAANLIFGGPSSGAAAFPTFRSLVSADLPPINLNTNGSNGGVTAILGFINGGCNATSASACYNNITPMTTAGDIVYEASAGVAGRLAAGTTHQLLHSGSAPSWGAVDLTADVTGALPIANGGSGQTTANAALNAFLPAQGGNSGKCLSTDGANTAWNTCGSGGGSGNPSPNYSQSFSSVTSVTLAGTSHNLGTKNLLLACYDNSAPAKGILPASWTVDGTSFDVVVSFASSQTGYCVLNATGPYRFASTFSSATSVTITGATHKLATADLSVFVWDAASGTRHQIIPASVSIDSTTFDVTVTFNSAQSGRIVLE